MNVISSYEERLKNPSLQIINFECLVTNVQLVPIVWSKYMTDLNFKNGVDEKRKIDPFFDQSFHKCFGKYYKDDSISNKIR